VANKIKWSISMTGKRLMIGSATIAVAALVSVSGASAFDGHRGGGGGHMRGEGARMGSGFSGVRVASPGRRSASGVTAAGTVAGQAYSGRYAGGYGRYGYRALGAGIGLGLAGWGSGYPGYAYSSGYDGGYPGYAYNSGYDWGYPGYASDSGYSWGYPGYASGNCTCGGHFTSGTAGAW
jgi:hypothetical protein